MQSNNQTKALGKDLRVVHLQPESVIILPGQLKTYPLVGTPSSLEQAITNGMRHATKGELPCECAHCRETIATLSMHIRDFLAQGLSSGTLSANKDIVEFTYLLMERWGVVGGSIAVPPPSEWEHA